MQDEKKVWFPDREKVLSKFQTEVDTGSWRKIPYHLWRELSHVKYLNILEMTKRSSTCMATNETYQFISLKLTPHSTETDRTPFETTFFIGDKSFGDFLETNWHSPALEDWLPYKNKTMPTLTGQTVSSAIRTTENISSDAYTTATAVSYGNVYNATTTAIPYKCNNAYIPTTVMSYNNVKDKEKEMDTSNMFNFDFGPVSSNQFRMSPYGLAIQTSNNGWVSYNAKAGDLMQVDIINFDMSKLIYKMPVPVASVQIGDIIIHAKKPVFVRSINQDGTISVINYANAEVSNILPVKSPFGFNFFTKVCALIDFSSMGATSDNPFGNMLPFLMMNDNRGDMDTSMLLAMSMMNGSNMDFSKNPMMMYLLMSGKDKSDMLPFVLTMMNGNMWNTASTTPSVTQ